MVGLIPKLLCDLVESQAGTQKVVEMKRRAGLPEDAAYRLDGVYDEEEWQRLLAAACETLQITQEQAEEAYADFFCRDAMNRWPMWFRISKSARELFERQPRIHNGFATGVRDPQARDAINDKFRLEKENGALIVHYRSPNHLCGLYRAIARWVLAHYREEAQITEPKCLKRGDEECEIRVEWPKG